MDKAHYRMRKQKFLRVHPPAAHWVQLPEVDGKVHVENGWLIRRTYVVGEPGETVERYVSTK